MNRSKNALLQQRPCRRHKQHPKACSRTRSKFTIRKNTQNRYVFIFKKKTLLPAPERPTCALNQVESRCSAKLWAYAAAVKCTFCTRGRSSNLFLSLPYRGAGGCLSRKLLGTNARHAKQSMWEFGRRRDARNVFCNTVVLFAGLVCAPAPCTTACGTMWLNLPSRLP